MLTGVTISPVVKSIFEGESGSHRHGEVQVKDIATVFFDSFKETGSGSYSLLQVQQTCC